MTAHADLDRRLGERRRERLDAAMSQLREDRRAHERHVEHRRLIDNARANHICALVYEAHVRGQGVPAR